MSNELVFAFDLYLSICSCFVLQHIDGDPNKKQKPGIATVAAATSAATGVSTKRQRDTISPNTKRFAFKIMFFFYCLFRYLNFMD